MKSPLLKCFRRPVLATGALFWVSLTSAFSQCLKVEDSQAACIATAAIVKHAITLKVTNQLDCTVPWITLHPAEAFTPNIIQLTHPLEPKQSITITTTLNGIRPERQYTFTMLTHCLREGIYCDPCRQEVTLDLPACDPKPPVVIPELRRSPVAVRIKNERFYLSVTETPNQTQIIETSADMLTWETVPSNSDDGATMSVATSKDQHRRYYRVRLEPKDE